MKKTILSSILSCSLLLLSCNSMAASSHAGHGSGGKGGKAYCKSGEITHIKPKHLTTVEPGSEFSFWVANIKDANQVEVTAKKIPVEMVAEQRIGFILFKGKLPESLKGTAARIQIKATSRKCSSQKGWLVKIKE